MEYYFYQVTKLASSLSWFQGRPQAQLSLQVETASSDLCAKRGRRPFFERKHGMGDVACNQWLALDVMETRSWHPIHVLQRYICTQPCHERYHHTVC